MNQISRVSIVFVVFLGVSSALPKPDRVVSQEVLSQVKEVSIFLNLPSNCSIVYERLIQQLENCRDGTYRGDPRLTNGCLLNLDLSKFRSTCENSKVVVFPTYNPDVEFPNSDGA
eukprot:TRINITY_DN3275_c0_g1_i7.p1 TRINITY_DN3275_c0_g1~~TRINITY_DN3275_c0_g1_i7.p1  ORF type:complete len:115 (-),score=12.25 TRINITY_DN3275_c0_g1_i7:30-374(-)